MNMKFFVHTDFLVAQNILYLFLSKIFTILREYVQLNLYDFRCLWLHIRLIAPQMT